MKESFVPVPQAFLLMIEEAIRLKKTGLIEHYQGEDKETSSGYIVDVKENEEGTFLVLNTMEQIRVDKIVNLFGQPGPAHEQVCFIPVNE
ncbi:hypothetical protein RCC89_05650 [Cytophagaceae bacterium ABcell3]|nr:hypothetical protein RCC89_05650 [Cytophagaceae bacterium ABcell3]